MLSPIISTNRWISAVLISIFMLFSTPTPVLQTETNTNETLRFSISQGIEFHGKLTRKTSPGVMLLAALGAAFVRRFRMIVCPYLRLSVVVRSAFRPIVARLLSSLQLAPSRLTSIYP